MESFSSASAPWGVFDQLTPEQLAHFRQENVEPLHAQLLFNRGIQTPEDMRRFLDARLDQIPDPHRLIDMEQALERISRALREQGVVPANVDDPNLCRVRPASVLLQPGESWIEATAAARSADAGVPIAWVPFLS